MTGALLAARLILAAVFVIAAVGKLARRQETAATLGHLGVPAGIRPALPIALPAAELTVACGLVVTVTAAWAGLAAFLLLAAFTAGIVRVLRAEEEVDCNCFGALAPAKVSRWTLARNLLLMGLAGFVAASGWSDRGASATAWIGELDTTALVGIVAALALVAAALNFAFSWQLMKQNGRLVAQLAGVSAGATDTPQPGLATGASAPAFALPDLNGRPVDLQELLHPGRGVLLFFTDPGCNACEPLLPRIASLRMNDDEGPIPAVIALGGATANREKARQHGLGLVLLADDFELARSFGVNGMPGVVRLDPEGRLVGTAAVGANAVGAVLDEITSPLRLVRVGAG
jgi:peroxiredoxin